MWQVFDAPHSNGRTLDSGAPVLAPRSMNANLDAGRRRGW
jgi:hypothetical protein